MPAVSEVVTLHCTICTGICKLLSWACNSLRQPLASRTFVILNHVSALSFNQIVQYFNMLSYILPSIQPACAVDASLRLLTNVLPAVLAFHLLLDDIVPTGPAVGHCNNPQAYRYEQELEDLIEEVTVREHYRSVIQRLAYSIVASTNGTVIMWPFL